MSIAKFKITLTLMLLCTSVLFAQQKTDSIRTRFNTLKSNDKINFYINLSTDNKRTYKDFFYENLPKLLNDEIVKNQKKSLIQLKFALAEMYSIKRLEVKAIEILKEIQNENQDLSQGELITLLIALQKSYLKLNLYPNVFKLNSEIDNLRKQGIDIPLWNYSYKSRLYAELYLHDKAVAQLKLEIKELQKNPKRDSLIIPSAYNDLGYYFSLNNQPDSAFFYFKKALKLANNSLKKNNYGSYIRLVATVKENEATLYITLKKYKKAIPLLKESIIIGLKNNESINGTLRSTLDLTRCYTQLKKYTEAKKTILLAEKQINNNINKKTIAAYNKTKAELLFSLNKKEEAYPFLEKAFQITDSLNLEKRRLLLTGNEVFYHLEEKDILIKKQQEAVAKKQKNLIEVILGFCFLLFTGIIYFINSRKKQLKIQKMNTDISKKNETIEASLVEKEILLKEIHHRVKNNLQIISGILELQNLTIKDKASKIILQEGQARIQSIALIHKTLYQADNLISVSFQNYLVELIVAIKNTYKSNIKIDTFIEARGISLNINTAIPLSLIINEIITNCFKHAFIGKKKGIISINFVKEIDLYKLTIKDDGNGFPTHFDPTNLRSIGFDLMNGLTQQLGGTLDWKNENGTVITIILKNI